MEEKDEESLLLDADYQEHRLKKDFSIKDLIDSSNIFTAIEDDKEDETGIDIEKEGIQVQDQSFLRSLIDRKIKMKMEELKEDKHDFDISKVYGDESFLNYTLDKENMMVRKEKVTNEKEQLFESAKFKESEKKEEKKMERKQRGNIFSKNKKEKNSLKDDPRVNKLKMNKLFKENDDLILNMNQLISFDKDEDYNVKFGDENNYQEGSERMTNTPAYLNFSNLIDNELNENEANENEEQNINMNSKPYIQEMPRLSLNVIDNINNSK